MIKQGIHSIMFHFILYLFNSKLLAHHSVESLIGFICSKCDSSNSCYLNKEIEYFLKSSNKRCIRILMVEDQRDIYWFYNKLYTTKFDLPLSKMMRQGTPYNFRPLLPISMLMQTHSKAQIHMNDNSPPHHVYNLFYKSVNQES